MREGLDAATLDLYTSGVFTLHSRLKVENGSDTPINLQGRYFTYKWRKPDPEEPIGSLSVSFIRETTEHGVTTSLAPFVVASEYNKLDDGTTYSPLLQLGRITTLEVALTTKGDPRPDDSSTLWYEVFRGPIVEVDWPKWDTREAVIKCHGIAAILEHAKSEAAYSYVQGTSIETVAREILDNNGFTTVPIYFPEPTGKVLPNDYAPGLQKTTWSQLWALAQSMGWICYYRYRGHNPPELTFFEPARDKTVSDQTVDARDFRALGIDEGELRNVGRLLYYDETGAQQIVGPFENPASIAKYSGSIEIRRIFWIVLGEDSPVRDSVAATDMLNAALLDVSDPDAFAEAQTHPMVFAESGVDLYTFLARDRFFDSDQTFAPFTIETVVQPDSEDMSYLAVRGLPTAGAQTWRNISGLPGNVPVTMFQYSVDEFGTNATVNYDPDVHLYARESRDMGATWTRWYKIAGSGVIAEVTDLTLSEPEVGRLRVAASLSESAQSWRLYLKKGGWPTEDGTWNGSVVEDYLRAETPRAETTIDIDFPDGGEYFAIARAVDNEGTIGPSEPYRDAAGLPSSFTIQGIVQPSITQAKLWLIDAADDYVLVEWWYNSAVTEANYTITIKRGLQTVVSGLNVDNNEAVGGGKGSAQDTFPEKGSTWWEYTYEIILVRTDGTEPDRSIQVKIADYFDRVPY